MPSFQQEKLAFRPSPRQSASPKPLMHRSLVLGSLALFSLFATPLEGQSLRGSRTSVDLMYRQAISHDLHFYETSAGVRRAASRGEFVKLNGSADYELGSVSHPYVLPATRTFVQRLASQYRAACGEKLVVTSGIRPKSLRLANSVDKSVHPTGMALDLRKPRNAKCLSWLRRTLVSLDGAGVIEATEERRPPHFHVAVFPQPYTRYVRGSGGTVHVAARTAESERETAAARSDEGERTYRVRRGDSLWTIARQNRVSVDEIKSANALNGSRIVAGQVLTIPMR